MKIHFFKFSFLFLTLFFWSAQSNAQTPEKLSSNFNIQLPNVQAAQSPDSDPSERADLTYEFDISDLKFKSELSAKRFFRSIGDNLAQFEVNYAKKTVGLTLKAKHLRENWSIEDWNKYLKEKQAHYVNYYERM